VTEDVDEARELYLRAMHDCPEAYLSLADLSKVVVLAALRDEVSIRAS
jgi:hypothetical protein